MYLLKMPRMNKRPMCTCDHRYVMHCKDTMACLECSCSCYDDGEERKVTLLARPTVKTVVPIRNKRKRSLTLSEREIEVVRLASKGLTNRQIAESLGLSFATAKNHLYHVYEKSGVASRDEAISYAMQNGLI